MKNDRYPDIIRRTPRIKKYVNNVERRLCLPRRIKSRVMSDFCTTVSARIEQGEGWEAIAASLGSPAHAAEELNEQMKEYSYSKSKWRFLALAAAALPIGWLLLQVLVPVVALSIALPSDAASVGIIGGADGPTAIIVTTSPISGGYLLKIALAVLAAAAGIFGFVKLSRIKRR